MTDIEPTPDDWDPSVLEGVQELDEPGPEPIPLTVMDAVEEIDRATHEARDGELFVTLFGYDIWFTRNLRAFDAAAVAAGADTDTGAIGALQTFALTPFDQVQVISLFKQLAASLVEGGAVKIFEAVAAQLFPDANPEDEPASADPAD